MNSQVTAVNMKNKQSISKAELKMALVAQRISMLQDDLDNNHHFYPISVEIPMELESSESRNETSVKCVQNLTVSENSKQGSCARTLVRDFGVESIGKDLVVSAPLANPKKSGCSKRKRATSKKSLTCEIHNASDNTRNQRTKTAEPDGETSLENPAMKRAKEVQASLPAEYPSFVKLMLPSHVSRVFWLHLPSRFCKDHLPEFDSNVELVDEIGTKFGTKYLAKKSALSGGWRGFSIEHGLKEGDVVVFQLIAPTTFKVYIVREGSLDEVDGALGLLTLDICAGLETSEKAENLAQRILNDEDVSPVNSASLCSSNDEKGSEVVDGIRFSDFAINFEAVKGFEDFSITVDGLVIDSKFSDDNRRKYYELCHSQKCFLHDHLLQGLNFNLVIGMILETINIADAITGCTYSTSIEDIRIWEKTLQSFELLGMNVSFMRAKLKQLLGIVSDLDKADECMLEQSCAAMTMKALESKLGEMKEITGEIDVEMDAEVTSARRTL